MLSGVLLRNGEISWYILVRSEYVPVYLTLYVPVSPELECCFRGKTGYTIYAGYFENFKTSIMWKYILISLSTSTQPYQPLTPGVLFSFTRKLFPFCEQDISHLSWLLICNRYTFILKNQDIFKLKILSTITKSWSVRTTRN